MKKIVLYCALALVSFALGLGGVYLVKNMGKSSKVTNPKVVVQPVADDAEPVAETESETAPADHQTETDRVEETTQTVVSENAVNLAEVPEQDVEEKPTQTSDVSIEVDVSAKRIEYTGDDTYRLKGIKATGDSGAGVRYVIYDSEGHKRESTTGSFEKIEANDNGSYSVYVIDKATGNRSKAKSVYGFKRHVTELSGDDIMKLINTGNRENLDQYADRFVKLKGCPLKCNVEGVNNLSQLCQKIGFNKVRVTKITPSYDPTGRITSLSVTCESLD